MTVNDRARVSKESVQFQKASWLVLIVSIIFLGIFIAFLWLRLVTPFDGARLQPGMEAWTSEGVVVTPLRTQAEGLRAGDLVVAVDGRTLESWAQTAGSRVAVAPRWQQGQRITYTVVRNGQFTDINVELDRYPLGSILAREWGPILFAFTFFLVAAFVFFRRPGEPSARVLLLGTSGILSASTWSFGAQVSDVVGGIGLWLFAATTLVGYMLLWISLVHLWFVFPRPHAVLQQHRWIVPLLYVMPYAFFAAYGFAIWPGANSTLDWLGRFLGSYRPLDLSYALLGVSAAIWRYRSCAEADRREMRLIWSAMILVIGLSVPLTLLPRLVFGEALVSVNVIAILGLLFPVSLAITILRYRLFDIEVIVNRTLTYGILTAIVISVYILVVGLLGALLQARGNLGISLLAVGVVAVTLQPLRQWLQRFINRWMYGQRDDPYGVLTSLGRRLEGALPAESILPVMVDTLAEALKIPYVAITLGKQEEHGVVAAHGQAVQDTLRIPLVYQGEEVGQILLAPRAPGETFDKADWKLLSDLARHAGVIAYNVRLTGDLRRARERLVISREEERRRLRRDLHDGLGPLLGSMMLKLDAARNMLSGDPGAADAMLDDIKAQTQQALADIRRLAYALRPPSLDQLGLVTALREYSLGFQSSAATSKLPESNNGLQVRFEVTADLPALSAAVEVAAYRVAVEALTNVARHSGAKNCVVRLSVSNDGALELEVVDDGRGLPPDFSAGVGIISMKERTSELGGNCVVGVMPDGGTRVLARIPTGVHHDSVNRNK